MKKVYLSFIAMLVIVLGVAQPTNKRANTNFNLENPIEINLGVKDFSNPLARQTSCIDTSMYPVYKLEDGANLDWGIPFMKYNDPMYWDGYYQTYNLEGSVSVLGFRVYALTDYDGTPGDGPDMPILAGVYNVSGANDPTTAIYTEQTVVVDSGFTYQNIMFSSAVSVTGNFAVGLQMDPSLATANDSVMVWGSQDGWGQGEYLAYGSYFGGYYSYGDMDFLIMPIVQYDIDAAFSIVQECSSITTTNMTQFVGGSGFDISQLYGANSYNWDLGNGEQRGDVDLTYEYWDGGTYTITLNKTQYMWTGQCMDAESVTISVFGINDVTATDATCGGSDAEATVVASGGMTPYSYYWTDLNGTNIGTTATVSGLSAGAALITVTDNNGCTSDNGVPVNNIGAPSITLTSENNSCFGSLDAYASVMAVGGTTPYAYTWTELQSGTYMGSTTSITGLSDGVYVIAVVDDLGCMALEGAGVWTPEPISVNTYSSNTSMIGGNDGQAWANASGGNWSGYSYIWSDGQTGDYASGLSAGVYGVTVADWKGCEGTGTVEVFDPTCNASIETWHQAYCDGSNETYVWDNSGPTPFTYLWSNGMTSDYIVDLAPGEYSVTGTDAQGCTDVSSVTVFDPNMVVNFTVTDETCGWQNGEVQADTEGGNPDYYYEWSHGDWGNNIGGLDGGVYEVTVTDMNGCTITDAVTVTGTEQMMLTVTGTDATCGANDASAAVTVTGGGATPYTYEWGDLNGNPLGNTATITGLAGGSAALVTVTDDNGCTEWDGVPIQNAGAPSVTVTSVSVTGCAGDMNGEVSAMASGGLTPYSYQWVEFFNPGVIVGTTATVTGLSTGFYIVSVEDAQVPSCIAIGVAELDEPDSVYIDIATNDVTYPLGDDGEAWENWTWGGTSPYSYEWSNGETSTWTTGLSAGVYDITVTDNNGCIRVEEFEIFAPACDVSVTVDKMDVSCFGMSDGELYAYPNGGSGPYDFYWSTGDNAQNVYDLAAGVYTITIVDNNGCESTDMVTITEPDVVTISITSTDENCGEGDGTATAMASGGTMPYNYEWSDGSFGSNINNLYTNSVYDVTVSDNNGCEAYESVTISGTEYLSFDLSITSPNCGSNDGSATLSNFSGGSGSTNYTYQWKDLNGNDLGTASMVTGLGVGGVLITVSDGTCTSIEGGPVSSNGAPTIITITETDVTCNGESDGSLVVEATGGVTPYSYQWGILDFGSSTTTLLDENNATISGIPSLDMGAYLVTVEGADGCGALEGSNVDQPDVLYVNLSATSVTSNGAGDGQVSAGVGGGTNPYSYTWNNSETTDMISNLDGGLYSVTVSDANGCTTESSVVVEEPGVTVSVPCNVSVSLAVNDVSTNGGSDGSVMSTVSGDQGSISYAWSTGDGSPDLAGLFAGVYTLTVTDAVTAGCQAVASATVSEPAIVVCDLSVTTSSTDENCGDQDGTATVAVTGGTGPYSYVWSTFDNMSTAENLDVGDYTVTVFDANLCETSTSVSVGGADDRLSFDITVTEPSCGNADGTATVVSVTGGSGSSSYTYSWTDLGGNVLGTTATVTGVAGGAVLITVSDGTCSEMNGQGVSEAGAPTIVSVTDSGLACFGDQNGSITVTATGGTQPYSYTWGKYDLSSSSTTVLSETGSVLSNVGALGNDQVYLVTVSGNDGCSAVEGGNLQEPEQLVATASSTDVSSNGAADGAAMVNVNGGTNPYTYLWSNGGTNDNISGLSGALYSVTVTDANGCMDDVSVVVTEPGVTTTVPCNLSVTLSATDVTSMGGNDGSVVATVAGDQGNVTYAWSNTGSGSNSINNLSAGVYSVTVTDDITTGCTATASITVNDGPNSVIELSDKEDLVVYPNPNTGRFTFELSGNGEYMVNIMNMIGQSVYTETINVADKYISTVDLNVVQSGIYFLTIKGMNTDITTKIVIQ